MQFTLRLLSRGVFATLLTVLFLAAPGLQAQQTGTVTGRVTQAQTGQPVPSVQVYVSGLDLGVLTQQNGRFLLQNVPAGTHTLSAERIGYRSGTQEITVSAGETVVANFTLSEEALQLDEVIVTGTPGGTARRALGNSVGAVQASDVTQRQAITSVEDLLSARSPGVNFQNNQGNVGAGSPIQIRGVSSLALGAQPLIYVDGVRIDNSATLGPDGGLSTGRSSSLNDFNPEDIETIEIIKGPAAATLYGTEASAGVIQILTKQGQSGAPEFSFRVRQGFNYMASPGDVLGPKYRCADPTWIPFFTGACPDPSQIRQYDPYEVANRWVSETGFNDGENLFQAGHTQGYNLSVRGGSDAVRYYLSGDWTDDAGIVPWNYDQKMSLRGNVNLVVSDNLSIDISTGYTEGETRFEDAPGEGGVFHELVWSRGYIPGVSTDFGTVFGERLPTAYQDVESFRRYNRFTGSVTANHTWDFLTQRLIVGLDKAWDTNSQLYPFDEDNPFQGLSYSPGSNTGGDLWYARPVVSNITFDYAASAVYDLTDAISTTTSIGTQYYFEEEEEVVNEAAAFSSPLQTTLNQGSPDEWSIDFTDVQNKSLGVYIQEQIGWNDRIFVTAAVRADDNSAFGSEFDLEYYPKVSAAWVISEEDFWNLDLVNSLRLRGAWGRAGRQPSTFAGVTSYTSFAGPGGAPGITPSSPGNEEVGPEVSTEIELGFDFALLDDRVSGEFSWYDQTVEDALIEQGISPTLGIPGDVSRNLGELASWGWEASVNARIYESDDFSFDLALSGDHTNNEIVSLGEGAVESANFQLGLPWPNVTGTRLVSVEETGTPGGYTNAMCDPGVNGRPGGEPKLCSDLDQANFENEVLYGPAFPTYTFSVGPSVTLFNDLQVFALAAGEYGRWIGDFQAQYSHLYQNTKQSLLRDDPMFVAALAVGDQRWEGRVPADFWKLREIGARYNLPGSLVSRIGGDRASISVSGRNLWTIWEKSETDRGGATINDPEVAGQTTALANTTLWTLPPIQSVNLTMRVTF